MKRSVKFANTFNAFVNSEVANYEHAKAVSYLHVDEQKLVTRITREICNIYYFSFISPHIEFKMDFKRKIFTQCCHSAGAITFSETTLRNRAVHKEGFSSDNPFKWLRYWTCQLIMSQLLIFAPSLPAREIRGRGGEGVQLMTSVHLQAIYRWQHRIFVTNAAGWNMSGTCMSLKRCALGKSEVTANENRKNGNIFDWDTWNVFRTQQRKNKLELFYYQQHLIVSILNRRV